MSFFKKIGSFVKKALPYAAMAAPFIPGIGPMLGSLGGQAVSKIAGMFGSQPNSAQAAAPPPPPPGVTQLPNVQVTGSKPTDWSSIIGAAGGAASAYGAYKANQDNIAAADKQMAFQAGQTGTAYQRGTADMQAAGLNPMLAYSQGGASSGAGATSTSINEAGTGVSSALQGAQVATGIKATQASTTNTQAQTELTEEDVRQRQYQNETYLPAQTSEILARASSHVASADQARALANLAIEQARNAAAQVPGTRAQSAQAEMGLNKARAYSDFYGSSVGRSEPYVHFGSDTINSAARAVHSLKPWSR